MIILGYILTILYVLFILGIGGLLKKKNLINEEGSRKLVHIFVSLAYIIMYKTIGISIHMIIIPIIFIILNYISYKKNLFEGMEISSRKSLGTVYYPLSMTIMATITYFENSFYPYYGIGLFIMAFADGIAPLVADKIKTKTLLNTNRSISGSLTVLIISILMLIIFKSIFNLNLNILNIVVLGLVSTILEFIGGKFDNLILPIGISIISYLVVVL